jgi:hypothetical protein
MILGNPNPRLTVHSYETPAQAIQLLNAYLANLPDLGVE